MVAGATVPESTRWWAAFSPDGTKLAFQVIPDRDMELSIVDTRTGDPPRSVTLAERQRLAGPAAWTSDGAQILLAAGERCDWAEYCADQTWHLRRLDVATGAITDETVRGRPGDPAVVAWRDGEPVTQQTRGYFGPCDTFRGV